MKKKLLFLIFLVFNLNLFSATFIVTNTNDSGPGSLREAVSNSLNGDNINFNASLISSGNATINLQSTININKRLDITGLMNFSDTLFISGQNLHPIFLVTNPCERVVLDNLALIDGYSSTSGGAILFQTSLAFVNNCYIRNCSANNKGGAIAFFGTTAFCGVYDGSQMVQFYLNNSTIVNCSSSDGGAVYFNSLAYYSYAWGVNPSVQGLNIANCNILNNSAANGGAIFTSSNSSLSYPAPLSTSYLKITKSTLANNNATGNGGAVYSYSENLNEIDISTSTLAYNSATGLGGAIYNSSVNTIDSIKFKNSTVVYNSSNGIGKAAYTADSSTQITVNGSIIVGNSFNESFNYLNEAKSLNYNLLSDLYPNISANPSYLNFYTFSNSLNLGPLQNNGGKTLTMLPLTGSVAINNGNPNDNAYAQNRPITDGMREIGAAESGCFTFELHPLNTVCQGGNYILPDGVVLQNILPNSFDYLQNYYKDLVVFPTSLGCDSIIEVTLLVSNPIYKQDQSYLCPGDSYTLPDGTYISSLNSNYYYRDTIKTAQNCDSIYTLLLVPRYNNGFQKDTVCYGGDFILPNGSSIYNVNTNYTYKDTLQVSGRCDSIYTLNIFPLKNSFYEFRQICKGGDYTFQDGTVAYNVITNVSKYDTISLSNGCDSFYHISLIPSIIQGNGYDFICPGSDYTLPNGTIVVNMTSTTVYRDTFVTVNGCDSIYRLNIIPQYKRTIEPISICYGDDYVFLDSTVATNVTSYTSNSTSYPISSSCDSVHVEYLVPYQDDSINVADSACYGENYIFPNGEVLLNINSDTTHISNLLSQAGCDSTVTTNVSVNQVFLGLENFEICYGSDYSFPDGNTIPNIMSDLSYESQLSTVAGCDSIIITDLLVLPSQKSFDSLIVCYGDTFTFPDGNTLYDIQSNIVTYESILMNSEGCDSSLTITIEMIHLTDSVNLTYISELLLLQAIQDSATYQWYDCKSNSIIFGDTNQIFEPTQNGLYQVRVSKNGCEVFSDCIDVTNISVGLNNQLFEDIKLFPNPVSSHLIVEYERIDFEFEVLDITGKEISLAKEKFNNKTIFDTQKLSSGIYFLNVKSETSSKAFKFVKE